MTTALALHGLPERGGLVRWIFAGFAILLLHAAAIAIIALWLDRVPPEPNVIPAIAVSLAPAASAPAVRSDDAIGTPQERIEDTPPEPPEPPKIEPQPLEQVKPLPPQPAEITLPKPAPQRERKKPVEKKQPAQEQRARATNDTAERSNVASATAYNSMVFGHLQRFKRYPDAAGGAVGVAIIQFTLNRQGQVLGSRLTKSSGNAVLDQEALAILRRANPFPPFPAEKSGGQDSFAAPLNFSQR